ncbi:MAG: hypothetical protein Q4D38_11585 [Planctomycetia bacterium]|nr:hypothetical protein [Planctomycetia bacterium]
MKKLFVFVNILMLFCIFAGCRSAGDWLHRGGKPQRPEQPVLSSHASALEVITLVNNNVRKIDSFSTTDATLSGKGFFNLKGEIAFKRPGLFRLRGSHAVSGSELDVGRNNEVCWLWVAKWEPKAVYYCLNSQYDSCQALQNLPIDPSWLISALGFGELPEHARYAGPFLEEDGDHLSLRLQEVTPGGQERTRVFVVNRYYGLPAAVRVYDKYNMLIADASVQSYRKDVTTGLMLPNSVRLRCPKENDGQGIEISIQFGHPSLNQLQTSNPHLWNMPSYPGYPPQDMTKMTPM